MEKLNENFEQCYVMLMISVDDIYYVHKVDITDALSGRSPGLDKGRDAPKQ